MTTLFLSGMACLKVGKRQMKLSINKVSGLLGGLLLSVISSNSWSVANCSFDAGATQTETVPLSPPVISAGADIPVGTILYQGSWLMKNTKMGCQWAQADVGKSFWYSSSTLISNAPLPLSGLMTGPFAGAVYQTNIPGIGVVISRTASGNPIIPTRPAVTTDAENPIRQVGNELGGALDFAGSTRYVSLIKTGPITPGSFTLSGANLPSIRTMIEQPVNSHPGSVAVTGLPFTFYNINFQGTLRISSQTCTTPDVSVKLGSFDIREHFTRIGATTPWVDASINLTNCPTFYGFYNSTNTTKLMDYNTGQATVSNALNNSVGVRLAPTTSVIDAANGVMAIDSTLSGSASGVGIQLGWGDSSQAPTLFNLASEQSVALPKDGSPTIRIPLAARYIQTAAVPTPGKAEGKVVFTVNYY
ncbi:fimbrial protein [Serratia fonticola]|uniref:fimbrial protein n=1 Tax=Serratia fonticola TaxID=47917 RepID=UPI0024DEBB6F|nr:fimbrial protein [Serratia fonticola]MDK2378323.1 fimbrial protein [Serratia fonticola]